MNRRDKAFTLVELIVVLVVMTVGLVTLIMLLKNASVNNAAAHFVTTANELAKGKMEELIGIAKKDGFVSIPTGTYSDETPVAGFDKYNRLTTVYYVAPPDFQQVGYQTDYKKVKVTVTSAAGLSTEVVLDPIFSDHKKKSPAGKPLSPGILTPGEMEPLPEPEPEFEPQPGYEPMPESEYEVVPYEEEHYE
ncbi:MAG: prepilin-type N-terminal cleavage/methylation domain-containing protein [Candidatus Omnitrophica bacterium]|nr:prepilin-type N-terminal cleavage/methylation domain-containing protein [Candidatus Omnitrophota bacterium]